MDTLAASSSEHLVGIRLPRGFFFRRFPHGEIYALLSIYLFIYLTSLCSNLSFLFWSFFFLFYIRALHRKGGRGWGRGRGSFVTCT